MLSSLRLAGERGETGGRFLWNDPQARREIKMVPSSVKKSEFRGHSGIFTVTDKGCHWR
jgi:hypothetical protein